MKLPRLLAAALAAATAFSPLHAQSGDPIYRPFALLGNPPPVQVLAPGFVVRELPLQLNNINNFTYSPDGRLFALGYDGNVYRLEDTDGDGLEDKAHVYYKNEHEVVASVGFAWGPGGLHLASRGRIIRLRERPDGTAELETAVTGWTPPDRIGGHYLDAYGLAFDRDGNLFFGIGIDDIRNGYRVDPETGVSTFSLARDRGTIQKVTPDGKREIYATGLRYTVALAFNAAGDLFATDQEGATWLPNGNPFDELLHIQPARHYGFPPRHPKYLPHVIDEPSLFDYGPQHQCTCGLHFNDPKKEGGPVFGPSWWRGDAIVAGEARGKIYRTKLVKSAAGYVARNEVIAHLSMLTIDAIPTPDGDLLVTCHSGRPDWGTGPTGKGKLFKISYRDRSAPQPVLAYAASPTETRVVFDRPLSPEQLRHYAAHAIVTMGEFVSGGDRFESFRPGYQAVKDQQKAPRYQLPILSADLAADQRTILLKTAPRAAALHYSVGLREGAEPNRPHDPARHELRQQAAVDLGFDLSGVQTRWRDARGQEGWTGWLPHLDLTVARGFTEPSAHHQTLFARIQEPGTLELETQLNLFSMLHPAVQPGSSLDYEYPPETVHVRFKSSGKLELAAPVNARVRRVSDHEWEMSVERVGHEWLPLALKLETGPGDARLDVSWTTADDDRPRALPLHRVLLPWASRQEPTPSLGGRREIPEIAGGDWLRGRELFFGASTCAVCHQVEGKGGTIGPDLSNLIHRDYASVMEDITEPNAALNPDFLAFIVETKTGESAVGTVVSNNSERVILAQANGEQVTFQKGEGTTLRPLGVSLMPPGLLEGLSEQDRKDLLTFLLTVRPEDNRTSASGR